MTPATRPRRSISTRTATTCRATDAAATPRRSPPGCASACRDLPQPRLRRLFHPGHRGVLAPAASRPEHPAAGGELFLLRLRPPLVPDPDRLVDGDRLPRGAGHGTPPRSAPPLHGPQH